MSTPLQPPEARLHVGHLKLPYGLQGWLWVHSLTDPITNLFDYQPWWICQRDLWQPVQVKRWKTQGKGYIVRLQEIETVEQAEALRGATIWIGQETLPPPAADEYYWRDLVGLAVYGKDEQGQAVLLGEIAELFETGANDVMAVKPCSGSVDQAERWIPWHAPLIENVDLEQQRIDVDWGVDY